jgi:predicted transcriptional regulator
MNDTKRNILKVATDMFSKADFDSISTRDIAKKAGVNLSAISYYFKNKEGLYIAVIKQSIDNIKERNRNWINLMINFSVNNSQDDNLKNFLLIMDGFVDCVMKNSKYIGPNSVIWSNYNSKIGLITEIVYERLHIPLYNAFAKIISSITNLNIDDPKMIFVVNTITGQLIEVLIHRDMILKTLNIKEFDTKQLNILKEVIINQTKAIINLYR